MHLKIKYTIYILYFTFRVPENVIRILLKIRRDISDSERDFLSNADFILKFLNFALAAYIIVLSIQLLYGFIKQKI